MNNYYLIIQDDIIHAKGETVLQALLNCPLIQIDIRQKNKSLEYYLIMPNYYRTKEHLICITSLDVPIKRALEYSEISTILKILGLSIARVLTL